MKRITIKALCITGFLLSAGNILPAQQKTMNAPSTDAKLTPSVSGNSSIGNIFSPNLYDGSANINVPIYSFANDYGDYGVSLGYNTKGVKVDELSGPLGVHWNLNAGGAIQRVVKDLPDELNRTSGTTDLFKCTKLRGKYVCYSETTIEAMDTTVYRDEESDDFVVSAGSLNFTFNLGKDGFVFVHPKRNISVKVLLNGSVVNSIPTGSTTNNLTFVITDEQGVSYYFIAGDTDKRDLDDGDNPVPSTIAQISYTSRWVIDRIVFPNNTQVSFSYAVTQLGNAWLYMTNSARENTTTAPLAVQSGPVQAFATSQSISRLTAISYPNHTTVDLVYDISGAQNRCDYNAASGQTGNAVLREIKVSDVNCIRYLMNQVYKVNPIPGSGMTVPVEQAYPVTCNTSVSDYNLYYRLLLKGVSIASCDGSVTEPYYSFEYDPMSLPNRLSGAQDYFGYYNGQSLSGSQAQLTIPLHSPVSGIGGAYGVNKDHNAGYAMAGLLRKVKNAYGGSLAFAYEGHSLSNPLGGLPGDALFFGTNADDGLRVASITEQDVYHPGNGKTTQFTYSGGQRFLTGGYFHYPTGGYSGSSVEQYMFNGIYVSPHQLVNGSNHGYSTVTTTVKDPSGNQLSKRIVTYTNFADATSGFAARKLLIGGGKDYYQWPFTDKQYIRDWELGLPLQVEDYDENNLILSRTKNTYEFTIDTLSAIGKVYNTKTMKIDAGTSLVIAAQDSYRPYTGKALLKKTTVEKFLTNSTAINDTLWYTYDAKNNPDTTIARNSLGEYVYTQNVYNYELSGPTTINNMNNMGLEKVVSVERWKKGATAGTDKLLDATVTGFTLQNGMILTQSQYRLITDAPVSYAAYTNSGASRYGRIQGLYSSGAATDFEKQTEALTWDSKGNVQEAHVLDEDVYKAMIWDTLTGQKLAEAGNCRLQDIAYSGFDASVKGNWNYSTANVVASATAPGGGIDGRYLLRVSSSDPSPIYVSALTPGREYIVGFWCKGGTPVLSGAGVGNIPLTVAYAPGNGWSYFTAKFTAASTAALGLVQAGGAFFYYIDDIRLHPANLAMQSWTYEPLFGISSEADATGRLTYYEYDALGRPVLARDQEGNVISKTEYHVAQ